MSLLGIVGGFTSQIASTWLGKATGASNRSQLGDCVGAVQEAGMTVEQALARYPQCAPYAAQMGGQIASIPSAMSVQPPYMPMTPSLPGVPTFNSPPPSVGGGYYSAPAGIAPMSIAYQQPMVQPAQLQMLKPLIPYAGAAAGAVAKYGRQALALLPKISRRDALSVGAIISGGVAFLNGSPVGKVRRRRRVNPLNYRAAMRAASRLCKVQDLTTRINQALPTASSPRKRFRKRRRKACR